MKTILDLDNIQLEKGIWKNIDTLIVRRNLDNSVEVLGSAQELKIIGRPQNLKLRMGECGDLVISAASNLSIDNIRCNNIEIQTAKSVEIGLVQCNNLILTAERVLLSGNIWNANIVSSKVKTKGLCSKEISVREKLNTDIILERRNLINKLDVYAKHIKLCKYDDNLTNEIEHIRLNAKNVVCIDIAKENISDSKMIIEAIAPEIKLLGYNTNAELICNGKLIKDKLYKIEGNELIINKAVPLSFIKEKFNSILIENLGRIILDKAETIYINELHTISKTYRNKESKMISLTNKDILVVNEAIKLSNKTDIDDSIANICVMYNTLGYAVKRTFNRKWAVIGIPEELIKRDNRLAMLGKRDYKYIVDTLGGNRNNSTDLGKLVRKGIANVKCIREEIEVELNYTEAMIVDFFRKFKQSDRINCYWVKHKEGQFIISKNTYGSIVGTYGDTVLFSVDIDSELIFTGLHRNNKIVLERADIVSRIKYIKKVLDYRILDIEDVLEYGDAIGIIKIIESVLRNNSILSIVIPEKQILFILTTRGWVGYDVNMVIYANTISITGDMIRVDNLEERLRDEYGI